MYFNFEYDPSIEAAPNQFMVLGNIPNIWGDYRGMMFSA
jgi:hypothetical protein